MQAQAMIMTIGLLTLSLVPAVVMLVYDVYKLKKHVKKHF